MPEKIGTNITLSAECVGKVITLQVFRKRPDDTLILETMRKVVGVLEYYTLDGGRPFAQFGFKGMHSPIGLNTRDMFYEVYVH